MKCFSCLAHGHMERPIDNYLIFTPHVELYFNLGVLRCQLENLKGGILRLERIESEGEEIEKTCVCFCYTK